MHCTWPELGQQIRYDYQVSNVVIPCLWWVVLHFKLIIHIISPPVWFPYQLPSSTQHIYLTTNLFVMVLHQLII